MMTDPQFVCINCGGPREIESVALHCAFAWGGRKWDSAADVFYRRRKD